MKMSSLFIAIFLAGSSTVFCQNRFIENKVDTVSSSIISKMFISTSVIRANCKNKITMMTKQGYQTDGLVDKLFKLPNSYDALLGFALELTKVPIRADFKYNEPFDLAAIQTERPKERKDIMKTGYSELEIRDKVHGGVFGEICGLTLGQPLEVWYDLPHIKSYLQSMNAWPLADYIPVPTATEGWLPRRDCIESMKGFVHLAKEDDDLNYLVLNSKILDDYGTNFTTENIARYWYNNLVSGWMWGPENSRMFLLTGMYFGNPWENLTFPKKDQSETFVRFLNDGEEVIGAMIRGQAFGFACPGKPALAAELAWREGSLTHAKTGLYAEMWLAATIAAAFSTSDPVVAIKAGIDQIPANSRYAECLREALKISLEEKDWLNAWKRISDKWGYLGHAGTMNESAAIINGLVHSINEIGQVDYEKAITITVLHGWDADCSGAMVGAIAGVMAGYNKIPEKWVKPLNDTYYSCVATERNSSISNLAERLYRISREIRHHE